jgi:catechol 2,3-dioxygenase-like lactoylglutathione lyase family enzyme
VISPRSLDHVALWVADRDELASFLCDHLGMHVIERTDSFTLVGVDARRGKLTLFAADGSRDPGVLDRVVLRVSDVERAVSALPGSVEVERAADGAATFPGPQGLGLGLASSDAGPDYDLDHVVLRVPEPDRTAEALSELGFARRDGRLAVADRHLRLERGAERGGERPLLNHLALLVESASELEAEARRRGLAVDDVVDAPNTLAVFVWGPDRIKLEYVEHKPGFALT